MKDPAGIKLLICKFVASTQTHAIVLYTLIGNHFGGKQLYKILLDFISIESISPSSMHIISKCADLSILEMKINSIDLSD